MLMHWCWCTDDDALIMMQWRWCTDAAHWWWRTDADALMTVTSNISLGWVFNFSYSLKLRFFLLQNIISQGKGGLLHWKMRRVGRGEGGGVPPQTATGNSTTTSTHPKHSRQSLYFPEKKWIFSGFWLWLKVSQNFSPADRFFFQNLNIFWHWGTKKRKKTLLHFYEA